MNRPLSGACPEQKSGEGPAATEPWYVNHFSPLDPRLAADFWSTVDDLRERCPVNHSDQHGGLWTFSRYGDVRMIGLDWKTFSSADSVAPVAFTNDDFKMLPIECDPPQHKGLRKLLDPYFTASAIEARSAAVRRLAVTLIDQFSERGSCEFMTEFALRFPALSFFEVLMDLPGEAVLEVTEAVDLLVFQPERAAEAFSEMAQWCSRMFALRRSQSRRDDVLDALLFGQVDDRDLTEKERLQMMINLIVGAMETTANGLGNMALRLAQDPGLQDRCRRLADLRPAVDEFLRIEAPAPAFGRTVTKDTEVDGQQIPAGARIVASLGSANRDPRTFTDPGQLRIGRANAAKHVTFGIGPHHCLGVHLAKLEMRIGLEEILQRMPDLSLDTEQPIRYRNALSRGPLELPLRFTADPL